MKRKITTLLILLFALMSVSQENMDYFLPNEVNYNQNIPTPEQFFGQKMGEWHLTHDQILNYMKEVDRLSDRVIIQEYARSYENRPLVHVIFTSEDNQAKLNELKALHVKHANPEENIAETDVPMVVILGYSIHGNESSGANSSVLTAYYLAAAQGEKIDKLLDNTIILVDPCLNPDGFTRHSTWANMHQSAVGIAKSDSRQFSEAWPGGRTNHYWFDLNRDYLLLVNPESRGRVEKFYEWLPNIITDHHEMGANSTFFFQPGVPTRNNPLTPEKNYELTHKIADFHAKYLDKIGAPYFSEEQFDDYYLGKGSSYPDINSSVGILFEQAGFRSRIRDTDNGIRKLAYGMINQFTVTLSTLDAAVNLKDELLSYQKEFYRDALDKGKKDPAKAYVFGNENDRLKSLELAHLLQKHQIEVYYNTKEFTTGNKTFKPGSSYVVPVQQKQYLLLKSLFEEVATFTDSTFYDVSTWNMPYTFDVNFTEAGSLKDIQYSGKVSHNRIQGKIIGGKSSLGYLFRWNEYIAPKALYALQEAGLMTKVATDNFSFDVNNSLENFTYGTILIPVPDQPLNENEIFNLIQKTANETGIDFYGLTTGLSPKGIDWGSNNFAKLEKPEILLFVGGSIRSSDAGEIWHLLDQRYQIPVTLTETDNIRSIDLNKYNTLILPGGSYTEFNQNEVQKIKSWVQNGGNLIAYRSAVAWASRNDLSRTKYKNEIKPDTALFKRYADRSTESNFNTISGAIFNTELDITHPLCYGYSNQMLPVFKNNESVVESSGIKYAEPVKFTSQPYLSGFVSDKNLARIKNAPVVSVQSLGRGKVICYYETMTFRGIWLGTNKLFANGIFFGSIIR